ncbi:MAG: hypothetical protein IJI35_14655 [Kiritimatiellae bacterium]|nr:hypothetical protein [Eggerthellaceae bacterium]MBQ6330257.1 hypothetical protein [Kiritimatiellia bacterium]
MSDPFNKRRHRRDDDPKGASIASKRMLVVAYATRIWKLKRTVRRG